MIRGFIAGAVLLTGGVILTSQAARADVEVCLDVSVIIPNTPVVLRQHPCVPLGLDAVPPAPPPIGGLPALPVSTASEPGANVCVQLSSDADGLPALDEDQCQAIPLVAPPPGVVPPIPPIQQPGIPPSVPPIPPHIPGTPTLPPLPIPQVPGVPIPPPIPPPIPGVI